MTREKDSELRKKEKKQRCFYGWKSKKLISIVQGLFPDGSSGYRQPEECLNREEESRRMGEGGCLAFLLPC